MSLNKKEKELLKKFKTLKEKQLALITFWLAEFPCEEYYKESHCILENLSPEQLYKFIEKKCQRQKK
jgi:hypothetical protein